MFSDLYLFILSARWWEVKDWNLTIAVQSSAFWILNKMMNRFAQASTEATFALRNMGEWESKLCECSWTKSLIIFLSVEILFECIGFCCYRGSMMRNIFCHIQLISHWEGGVKKIMKSKKSGIEGELRMRKIKGTEKQGLWCRWKKRLKVGEKEFTTCWFGSSWQGIFSWDVEVLGPCWDCLWRGCCLCSLTRTGV